MSQSPNERENELCLICGLEIEDGSQDEGHTLSCNHTFHYQCLVLDFNIMGREGNSKDGNKCPLCRHSIGFLPLKEPYLKKPVPFAHYIVKKKPLSSTIINLIKGKGIKKAKKKIKTDCLGKTQKGQPCIYKTTNKNGYCNKHQKQCKPKTNKIFCKSPTLSGHNCKNYGNPDGYCTVHKTMIEKQKMKNNIS